MILVRSMMMLMVLRNDRYFVLRMCVFDLFARLFAAAAGDSSDLFRLNSFKCI